MPSSMQVGYQRDRLGSCRVGRLKADQAILPGDGHWPLGSHFTESAKF